MYPLRTGGYFLGLSMHTTAWLQRKGKCWFKMDYRTCANKGRSWIVTAPKNLPKMDVFLLNFLQPSVLKIDKIWQNCTIMQDWKNAFWIEAASFIGVGTVSSEDFLSETFGAATILIGHFHFFRPSNLTFCRVVAF